MITKPQIGMRVKCVCPFCSSDKPYIGKIVDVHDDRTVSIIWDGGGGDIFSGIGLLKDITQEEQRRKHADKYL